MAKASDLVGQTFGQLTVVMRADIKSNRGESIWVCKCSCGGTSAVLQWNLRSGNTKSCGCLKIAKNTKHGKINSREYNSWAKMTQRCRNKENPKYNDYGGRGITICDRWKESFENFLEDMGYCPEGLSLDRIDVNGNYEPGNCRWTDNTEQSYNQRLSSRNTSGKSGVCFHQNVNKWHARISKENKQYHLGYYDTFEEAVAAREKAELELYGYSKQ